MTSARVIETSVTTTDNSPSQDYTHLHDPTTLLNVTPGVQTIYCSTFEVKKKSSNQPCTMKRTQGRVSRHSTLAYVLGLFLKINTTLRILFSTFKSFFPGFWTAFDYVCTHWQLKPFSDVEKHMFGYYRQDMSCSPIQIFQVFCHMPRKNHLDISCSRLQHNQVCRSKNHLKEERVKVPVVVMSGFKYILIICENKNINRQHTWNLVE